MPSVSVRTLTVLTLAALAACGDNLGGGDPDGTAPDATDPDASTIDASTIDASTTDAPVDGPPDIGTVQCPTPVPAAQDGTCDVTAGSGAAVLVQGNVLVHTGVYLDGAVLYQGDHVVCVGCDCGSAPEAATATADRHGLRPPPVALLLEIDRRYRAGAAAGTLRRLAPRRHNPRHEAWLPVLHVELDGWELTALFSNTARAHQLGRTHDWVVIYYHHPHHEEEGRATVVTEHRGPWRGHRVVRGREAECAIHALAVGEEPAL